MTKINQRVIVLLFLIIKCQSIRLFTNKVISPFSLSTHTNNCQSIYFSSLRHRKAINSDTLPDKNFYGYQHDYEPVDCNGVSQYSEKNVLSQNVFQSLGADSFGDIMGSGGDLVRYEYDSSKNSSFATADGLVTSFYEFSNKSSILSMLDFSPIERIVLTSNGNLQRIMNSYYGAKVTVKVIKCLQISTTLFDRQVELYANDKKFCTATGKINVSCVKCLAAVSDGQIGVGQLFRYLRILPSFTLLDAGRVVHDENSDTAAAVVMMSPSPSYYLKRHYLLSCSHFSCEFMEVFEPHFLDADFLTK